MGLLELELGPWHRPPHVQGERLTPSLALGELSPQPKAGSLLPHQAPHLRTELAEETAVLRVRRAGEV